MNSVVPCHRGPKCSWPACEQTCDGRPGREANITLSLDHIAADYDEIEFGEDDYDPVDDCALGDDGQCGHAGSEFCDFECPMRDSARFVGSEAWKRAHATRK